MRTTTLPRRAALASLAGTLALATGPRPVGASPLPEAQGTPAAASCVVRAVHDGDTFTCHDGTRVRLIGIDAPELDQAPAGAQARQALAALIPLGRVVQLQTDVTPRDRYGRLLAYVWNDRGAAVNLRLAAAGYVVPLTIPPNVAQAAAIAQAVAAARRAGRGLWATPAFTCSPSDHRRHRC